jgi:transcription-repair coupling factor (superfamily II helicase)
MYTKILEEAVAELKEQEFAQVFTPGTAAPAETQVDADLEAYLPDVYIDSDTERLDIYRRLYRTTTAKEVDEIRLELADRFGAPTEEADNLFRLAKLRVAASTAGFRRVELNRRRLRLFLPTETDTRYYEGGAFQRLMATVAGRKDIFVKQEGKNLCLQSNVSRDDGPERVDEVLSLIDSITS